MANDLDNISHRYKTVLLIIGVLAILPFLLLAFYNHPSYDDYHLAIRDAGNGFWQTQVNIFNKWSGRYAATAVAQINPLLYRSFVAYKLYSFALILLLAGTIFFTIYTLFKPYLGKYDVAVLSSILLVTYLAQMPDVAQGLYWFSGYMTYQLANILTLLFILCLYKLANSKADSQVKLFTLLAMFSGATVIGLNEMSLVGIMVLLGLVILHNLSSSTKYTKHFILIGIVCLLACLLVVFAPGSYERMHTQPDSSNVAISVMAALGFTAIAFYKWGGMLTVVSILYALFWGIPLAQKRREQNTPLAIDFRISIVGYLIAIASMYFVYAWATGARAGSRAENVIYFFFILGWFFNLQLLLDKYWSERPKQQVSQQVQFILPAVAFLFLLSVIQLNSNITTAYLDLMSGDAEKFDEEMNRRYAILKNSSCEPCAVPTLTVLPKSLYIWHMLPKTEVEEMGVNRKFKDYWGKNMIHLNGPIPDSKTNINLVKEIGKNMKLKFVKDK